MNYAEYKVLKDSLERKLRLVSLVPIFIFLAVIFQFVLLVVGTETNATWFNVILIDQLFSNGHVFWTAKNIVLAVMCYGGMALLMFAFAACAFFCYRNLRFAYQVLLAIYLVDTALAIVSINYYQIAVHLAFLAIIVYAIRNIRHLDSIPRDVWGFFD